MVTRQDRATCTSCRRDGGKPIRLTSDPGNEVRPSWSSDGQWIYYGWSHGTRTQIWKMPASGGAPTQVSRNGGSAAFETSDAKWLYVMNAPKLVRMRPDGSDETTMYEGIGVNFIAMGGRHLYVLDPGKRQLMRAVLGDTALETVHQFDVDNAPIGGGTCIGVPRDESKLIYRREVRIRTTLMLIDKFR